MEPSPAHWRNGTKVGQGGVRPGRHAVCVRRTMPALQSVSSVLSAKQTLYFPLGLAAFAFFSGPIKVRRACADKESFISHLNNENPNRLAASSPCSAVLAFHQTRQQIFCGATVAATPPSPVIEFFALRVNCSTFPFMSFR